MALKQYLPENESKSARLFRYAKGTIACLLALGFALWAGWGWLIVLPLVFDYFFTKYINWAWGRDHENPMARLVISLVGDLLYVVIAVSFIFTFFFQNFGIPSSSLEKTLLTGDYLFVSKLKYGPRLPMTPVALPLVHNRLWDSETYSSSILCDYKRLPGYGKVERGDLVVFNFPAGDTVATKMTNPDYLTLCHLYGREVVHSDRAQFGEIIYRPIDRRDHYVKRLIGMPGDQLEIKDTQVYIDGKPAKNPSKMQLNYYVQTDGSELSQELLDALEINYRDVLIVPDIIAPTPEAIQQYSQAFGFGPIDSTGNFGRVYEIPLTHEMVETLGREPIVKAVNRHKFTLEESACYPLSASNSWTVDNYGPIVIPKQGMTIELNDSNYLLYERCIRAYEGHILERRGTAFLIDGKPQTHYTFAQNYYWMMGDNRHNSADSRAWGFVPEDHIVGTPSLLWLSLNDEQGLFSGRIRWSRMFSIITGKD
ncbi:MAG: signal peptidase I [Porphyromonas sp.]|nr:signal peptidase I [Porphyromonas sp.]